MSEDGGCVVGNVSVTGSSIRLQNAREIVTDRPAGGADINQETLLPSTAASEFFGKFVKCRFCSVAPFYMFLGIFVCVSRMKPKLNTGLLSNQTFLKLSK